MLQIFTQDELMTKFITSKWLLKTKYTMVVDSLGVLSQTLHLFWIDDFVSCNLKFLLSFTIKIE